MALKTYAALTVTFIIFAVLIVDCNGRTPLQCDQIQCSPVKCPSGYVEKPADRPNGICCNWCDEEPNCTPNCSLIKIKCAVLDSCPNGSPVRPRDPSICKCCDYCEEELTCEPDCRLVDCNPALSCPYGQTLKPADIKNCKCCAYCL